MNRGAKERVPAILNTQRSGDVTLLRSVLDMLNIMSNDSPQRLEKSQKLRRDYSGCSKEMGKCLDMRTLLIIYTSGSL